MNTKNHEPGILVRFEQFFHPLKLSGIELEKQRQGLTEADAIIEHDGKKYVSLKRSGAFFLDELDSLREKALESGSDQDLIDYSNTAFDYLYVFTNVLSSRTDSPISTGDKIAYRELGDGYKRALGDFQKIWEHLRTSVETSIGIDFPDGLKE